MSRTQRFAFFFLVISLVALLVLLRSKPSSDGDLDWPAIDSINGIKIESSQGLFVASRRGGEWSVSQPERGVGQQEAIEDLLLMGTRIRVEAQFPNGERSHYGLNPPQTVLELRGGDIAVQVAFGKKAPAHYASYIQVDNGPVLAVTGYPVETLMQDYKNLYEVQALEGL